METFREFEPHPALAAFVDRFWMHAGSTEEQSAPGRILPDGCIDLVVDLEDGSSEIVGTMTRAAVLPLAAPVRLVGVRFRPGGASRFLRVDAHELTDRVVDVRDFGVRWLEALPVTEETELLGAVDMLQRALLAQLPGIDVPDRSVMHAVSALFASAPPSIDALARELGCSRQHLRRMLRGHVGLAPVQLARVARLQRAVVALQGGEDGNLAETALRLGYYDQAHLNRDFRDLAGLTPRQAAADGSIFPIRSLLRLHDSARK